jgi:hypothetical protein
MTLSGVGWGRADFSFHPNLVIIMSMTNSFGTEDPGYYAELFFRTSRPAERRLPSDE